MDELDDGTCLDQGVHHLTTAAVDLVKTILTYFASLSAGVFLALTISTVIGYLPYSDRPGPGWYEWEVPPLGAIAFYLNFSVLFLGIYAAIAGTVFYVLLRILGALRMPRWAVSVYGALTVALVSLVVVDGVGWYIAIAAFPVYAAGIVGFLYGALILPRFVRPLSKERRRWWHWVLSPVAPAAVWLYFLLPR